jgi:predicted ATPase/DNA-binding XRE family transcriptional regulator
MTTLPAPAFGELLRQHRIAAGLTQEELAERAQISVRAISDLERGVRRAPHKDTLRLLADALNLTEDDHALLLEAVRVTRRAEATALPSTAQMGALPHDFPVTLTPLVGREREEAAIAHLLARDDVRLLTLTGPAGIGKTRLATQTALGPGARFASVVFISLAAIGEHTLVLPALAQALGLHDQPNQLASEQLSEYLSRQEALLILDNFEQVAQAGPQIAQLLAVCPQVKTLITSRVALRVRGEHEFAVPPLDTPDLARLPTLEDLTRYAAVTLFMQRAQAVKPNFEVTPALAPTIAAICTRLDGIPLALELAAARIKLLAPPALLARLDRSLTLLTDGAADLPERQQTMRRAIEWSYDLLSASEQRLFRHLATFAGGWTLEAAEAICGESAAQAPSILDGLTTLVNSSLVVQEETADGEPRFRLLELIREYGQEQLVAHDETSALRSRHADYYRALAEKAEPEMHGDSQRAWLACLAQEHPNLRAALDWARETYSIECGLRLGSALWWFWQLHGHASEGRAWLEHFLSVQQTPESVRDKTLRADALKGVGNLAWTQGDYEPATVLLDESLCLYRALANTPGVAFILNTLGLIADEHGAYARAAALFEESLALWRELRDVTKIGALLTNLAVVEYRQEHYAKAISLFEEGLALQREANDHWSVAVTLSNLGEAMQMQGELTTAAQLLEESLELHRELGDKGETAYTLRNLADVVREQGNLERAALLNCESLAIASEAGIMFAAVDALESMAEVTHAQGRDALAAQLLGLATVLREKHQMPRPNRNDRNYASRIDDLRATLGEKAFATAWAQRQSLSLEEALKLVNAHEAGQETVTTRPKEVAPSRHGRK